MRWTQDADARNCVIKRVVDYYNLVFPDTAGYSYCSELSLHTPHFHKCLEIVSWDFPRSPVSTIVVLLEMDKCLHRRPGLGYRVWKSWMRSGEMHTSIWHIFTRDVRAPESRFIRCTQFQLWSIPLSFLFEHYPSHISTYYIVHHLIGPRIQHEHWRYS